MCVLYIVISINAVADIYIVISINAIYMSVYMSATEVIV